MSVICKGGEGDACKSSVVILWFFILDLSCSFYSHLRETDPSLAHNVSLAFPGLHLVYEGRLTTNHVKNRHKGERGEVYPERGSLCIFLMSFHDSNKARGQKSIFPTVSPAFFLLGSHDNTKQQLSCFGSARPMAWAALVAREILMFSEMLSELNFLSSRLKATWPYLAKFSIQPPIMASPAVLHHTTLLYFFHAYITGLSPLSYSFIHLLRSSQTCLCMPTAD